MKVLVIPVSNSCSPCVKKTLEKIRNINSELTVILSAPSKKLIHLNTNSETLGSRNNVIMDTLNYFQQYSLVKRQPKYFKFDNFKLVLTKEINPDNLEFLDSI